MTDLSRLRELLRGAKDAGGTPTSATPRPSVDLEAFAAALGGTLEEGPSGPCPVVRWWCGGPDGDAPYGGQLAAASSAVSTEGLRALCGRGHEGEPSWSGPDPRDGLVFFDLETTGLSGGSGTVAFVVGFGCFVGARFHVWQFVLPSFASERRLLAAVTAAVARAHTLVTFNGKSFDVPFMEMRWLYQRLETPLPALRHLDLLHPARRLWGPETGGLGGLEERVLGFRRDDDVPGFEIPARYFQYLRSGDARPLRGVLAHNLLDLVSLGVLTGMACDVVDRGAQAAGSGRQSLGLGRLYERGGREADAPGCYERAVALTSGARGTGAGGTMEFDALAVRAEALYRLALACRRQHRHSDAARYWQTLIDLGRRPAGVFEREALRALAVHHEHRLKDTDGALNFARRAYAVEYTAGRRRDVERRLTRLERRLANQAGTAASSPGRPLAPQYSLD
ncbi:MAG: ribonuclease H-like domain-containing protein [Vicinamibacterales bacterium]|nr:ribonuclease H-like domain-containing protein [Vicinamibacterales bacterium]